MANTCITWYGGMDYDIKYGKWVLKAKMWRVVRSLYINNRSCMFLDSKSSNFSQLIGGLLKGVLCHLHCS